MRLRIAITGIGTLSSVARNSTEFLNALKEGRRGFSSLDYKWIDSLRATHAGIIKNFGPNVLDPPEVQALDRNVHLALAAAREAIDGAGLSQGLLGDRGGVVLGTCSGGMLSIEKHYEALKRGEDPINEDLIFSKKYYTTAKVLAWAAGAYGPVMTVVTACAAGTGAVVQAADLIRSGLADVVIAGGADAFSPSTLVGFDALKATCEGMCAPFSHPIGLNLGEGAAFLVLEEFGRAVDRGATILAELLGCGLSNDAYHPTAPDPSAKGQLKAMESALTDAGISAANVDYVNAHGTGTRANDPAETRAIGKLLRERTTEVPVSSTKSMVGHCLGAAGALEAAASIMAVRDGFVPPTAGFTEKREGCDLDYVPDIKRAFSGRIVLSNSFGFAGNNACLALDTAPSNERCYKERPTEVDEPIVISGAGVISPGGVGVAGFLGDASYIGPVDRFQTPVTPYKAGLVPQIDSREVGRRLDLKGMDLCSRFAVMATRLALDEAGLKPRPRVMEGVGMVLGIASGPGDGEAEHLKAVFESDFEIKSLGAFPYVVPNEVAGNVTRSFLLKGYSTVLAWGQGAGLSSLVSAAAAISHDHADTILAAAADQLTERSISDDFKMARSGPKTVVTPGEGAAVMVVEKESVALARGAKIRARLLGYSLATDGSDPRKSNRTEVLSRAIVGAIERAGKTPEEITNICVGGPLGAASQDEIKAINSVFGDRLSPSCLSDKIGFAEASLPLFNLAHLMGNCPSSAIIVSAFVSREGLACAVVVENL